jgi:cell division protein FtsQ
VNPSNRRVGKPKLPPDVMSDDYDVFGEEEAPRAPAARPAQTPRSPRLIRAMAVLQTVLGAAVVLTVAVSVAWAARRYVRESPRFALKTVRVTGARHRTSDEILQRAGLTLGTNLFSIELEEARARLATDPWLEKVSLVRHLPGTIAVDVLEREPSALVAVGDTTYLATREGEIFKRLEVGDPVDLPVVSGLSAEAVANDREGAIADVHRALDLAADYADTSLGAKAPLQQVHVGDDGAMLLIVGKSGLTLSLGKAPFRRKLDQAGRVAMELERRLGARALSEKTDGIMLDSEARPERVVVRMR